MGANVRARVRLAAVRSWAVVYLKGFAMGMADAVPGVSGGTIALITGIYARLIGALNAVGPTNARRLLRDVGDRDWDDLWRTLREMDLVFLAVLGVGIVTAVVAVTSTVEAAVHEIPVPTFGFFFGLIAASAAVLVGEVSLTTRRRQGAAVAGFVLAFVVSGRATELLAAGSLPVVFLAGAVAICAMILPGISGSLILLILGQYVFLSGELSAFKDGVVGLLLGDTGVGALAESGAVVVTFLVGAVIGLFTVARVVGWALDSYRKATFTFLIFLIVGALRAPIVQTGEHTAGGWSPERIAVFAGAALLGAAAIFLVDRYAADIDLDGAGA